MENAFAIFVSFEIIVIGRWPFRGSRASRNHWIGSLTP